mmetsp:Transcript_4105/g.12338  ORF Transcript_4105/g.12338 Transcript_4105/m.12338 type:complete len:807 (+) Transcript_4105:176-2596(+)|eukprot:CAMPEP_0198733350 /NCGR_PEP_ID=MMETSP1475-20131203/45007_1 /TAXON_ID= ORGANISM="Unidentified sp., Strain CCMP1999" /NCGR_SAMPLE_ID=MMETSP1475 /ASSEMBLY_ACC=CAM_ASM_001111 /LENGTH=806 /DNA_ID=CAMNT_0044496635 /DNA_START=121 /DNA_END=2541 /DNA_ORIENTATION=+
MEGDGGTGRYGDTKEEKTSVGINWSSLHERKREDTSGTKISAVSLEGVSVGGAMAEPEQVIEEELLDFPPPDIENIDDHSSDADNTKLKRSPWGFSGNVQTTSETLRFHNPTPLKPSEHTSQSYNFQRSKSVPASRNAPSDADVGHNPISAAPYFSNGETLPEADQKHWLSSAAERALAASGDNTTQREQTERSMSFLSQSDASPSVDMQGASMGVQQTSTFVPTVQDLFGRANSYAAGTSAAKSGLPPFSALPHHSYSGEFEGSIPGGWGSQSSPMNNTHVRGPLGPQPSFTSFGDSAPYSPAAPQGMRGGFPSVPMGHMSSADMHYAELLQEQQNSHPSYAHHSKGLSRGHSQAGAGLESKMLHVDNIAPEADVEGLRNILEGFGKLDDFYVCMAPTYDKLNAAATYRDARKARLAMSCLNGFVFAERVLRVFMKPTENWSPNMSAMGDEPHTSMEAGQPGNSNGKTVLVMNFGSANKAGKVRRAFGGHGQGKTVEFYDAADVERALRMLNISEHADSVRIGSKSSGVPVQRGYMGFDGPALLHSISEPAVVNIDPASFMIGSSRINRNGTSPLPSMVTSPPPPAQNQSSIPARYQLNIAKVMSGEETRTALMIRNIPNKYTQKMMLQALDANHRGVYDFFYLPIDFKNKCNVGYAFINFRNVAHIVPFFKEFHRRKWSKFNSEKVCEITFARIQGKASLIAHFQNSSLMNEDPKCRPIIFSETGEREEFPVGPHVRTKRGPSAREARLDTAPHSPPLSESASLSSSRANSVVFQQGSMNGPMRSAVDQPQGSGSSSFSEQIGR